MPRRRARASWSRISWGWWPSEAAQEKQELSARLERALGKRILLEERMDSTLLGGFVAQVGSLILDGSLDGQLARLRQRLAGG